MSDDTLKLQGPVEAQIKVHITNSEGQHAIVTLGMAKGSYPTEAQLRETVQAFAKEDMPEGFRLMTKREWFDALVGKVYDGQDDDGNPIYLSASMPGGSDWDGH